MSLARIELIGLNKIKQKVRSMNLLVHNFEDTQRKKGWFPYKDENKTQHFFGAFEKLIFLSEYMRTEALTRFNLNADKTYVMLHPHFHPMLKSIQPDINLVSQIKIKAKGKPIMAYVSRLDFKHGIDIFYRALEKLDVYGVVLGRLGKGWSLEDNQTLLKELEIDSNKVFLKIGNYSYSELLGILNLSDFVLAPYRQISQSGAIALVLGEQVPVIASNVGANGEMVRHGINGLLFESNNLDLLIKEIDLIYGSGKNMREQFLPTPSFNSHLDPELAVKNMLNWITK
jgi:glycosyltransferase involved in cell wall biosynthesis